METSSTMVEDWTSLLWRKHLHTQSSMITIWDHWPCGRRWTLQLSAKGLEANNVRIYCLSKKYEKLMYHSTTTQQETSRSISWLPFIDWVRMTRVVKVLKFVKSSCFNALISGVHHVRKHFCPGYNLSRRRLSPCMIACGRAKAFLVFVQLNFWKCWRRKRLLASSPIRTLMHLWRKPQFLARISQSSLSMSCTYWGWR